MNSRPHPQGIMPHLTRLMTATLHLANKQQATLIEGLKPTLDKDVIPWGVVREMFPGATLWCVVRDNKLHLNGCGQGQ